MNQPEIQVKEGKGSKSWVQTPLIFSWNWPGLCPSVPGLMDGKRYREGKSQGQWGGRCVRLCVLGALKVKCVCSPQVAPVHREPMGADGLPLLPQAH